MTMPKDFGARLQAVRESELLEELGSNRGYRNGQLLAGSDDVSQWDNYDRYFKFYNISIDE